MSFDFFVDLVALNFSPKNYFHTFVLSMNGLTQRLSFVFSSDDLVQSMHCKAAKTISFEYLLKLQSGASSLAKHGGAYFSAVCGSIQDPIVALGPFENQEF